MTSSSSSIGTVLLLFAAAAQAQTTAPAKGNDAKMMSECLAREQKKSGVDRAAAELTCRGQSEAHRDQSSAPNADRRPASGKDGASASGHSSHSAVKESPSSEKK